MPRQIVDIKGLQDHLPLNANQIYKAVRRADNPLPYKKCGKKLFFDLEKIWAWFDSLPGRDLDAINL